MNVKVVVTPVPGMEVELVAQSGGLYGVRELQGPVLARSGNPCDLMSWCVQHRLVLVAMPALPEAPESHRATAVKPL